MKTIKKYLTDILERIARIEQKIIHGYDEFSHNQDSQDVVIRSYEIIGEIVKRLPDELLSQYTQVDWRTLKGFRDFLAHNYDAIELPVVWIAIEKLPVLRSTIETMLAHIED